MPTRNYSNTAVRTALASGITDSATSLTVNDATGWPTAPFTIQINDEVILVGARTGTSCTSLTRGYDNTTNVAHSADDVVEHKVIAKDFDDRPESSEIVSVPTGALVMYVDDTPAPTDWLICDGAAVSRTTYADLFAVIGTVYGVGDGSTTFNLPNFVGRIPLGFQSGTYAMAGTGGAATHTLTTAEMPQHNHGSDGSHGHGADGSHGHTGTAADHTHSYTVVSNTAARLADGGTCYNGTTGSTTGGSGSLSLSINSNGSHSHSSAGSHSHSNAGSGSAHENMPPYLVVQFIIKT